MNKRGDTAAIHVGERYGSLTIIKFNGRDSHRNRSWLCQCDCGNTTVAATNELRRKDRVSCGCRWRKKKHNHIKIINANLWNKFLSGYPKLG